MNSIAVVIGATVAAFASSFVVVSFLQPAAPDPSLSAGPSATDLDTRLSQVETQASELREKLTWIQSDVGSLQTAAARTADPSFDDAKIRAAVLRLCAGAAIAAEPPILIKYRPSGGAHPVFAAVGN